MIRSGKASTPLNLLSTTEWSIVHQLHRLERPVSAAQISQSAHTPSPPAMELVEAVLARLYDRGIVRRSEAGWSLAIDFEQLFRAQIQSFLDTYIDNDPLGWTLLREALYLQER